MSFIHEGRVNPCLIKILCDSVLFRGSEGPVAHATGRCDGRQEGCERGYYDLHRNLYYTLLHLLISFLLGISCLRNLGI